MSIALATATFSVVDAVVLRPLPFKDPSRLVDISLPDPSGATGLPASPSHFHAWKDGAQAFEGIAAARFLGPVEFRHDGGTERLVAQSVSAGLFDVLGVRMAAGRAFVDQDHTPGAAPVVLISERFWRRELAADPRVIGRSLVLSGTPREVVGVLPADVWFPLTMSDPPDVYQPLVPTAADRSNDRALSTIVVGRLRHGVTVAQARADLERLSSAIVTPLSERIAGRHRGVLLLALAATGVVLLAAAVNVAMLLLAKASARSREYSIRLALGTSRGRLALSAWIEGLMIGGAATVAALAVTAATTHSVTAILPSGINRVSTIAVNGRVLGASFIVALLTAAIYGVAPAWIAARGTLSDALKHSGHMSHGPRRRQILEAFLVANIAFVCVLMIGAALVLTSFARVVSTDLGFDRRGLAAISYQTALDAGDASQRQAAGVAIRTALLERARSVPGVTDATIVLNGGLPLTGAGVRVTVVIPGIGETPREDALELRVVSPDYFSALGVQQTVGRMFETSDRLGAPAVAVINEVAAQRFFGGRNPVGATIVVRDPATVVGVVRGVHLGGPESDVRPELYLLADQQRPYLPNREFGMLVVRTTGDARAVMSAVRSAVQPLVTASLDEPVYLEEQFLRLTAVRRVNAALLGGFGAIALALAVLGVFGTTAFVVAQEVPAIGVRMALGASPARVLRGVLKRALWRIAIGTACGLVLAWAASRFADALVFGIGPADPMVYGVTAALLIVAGAAAAFIPAVRASRIDPIRALRAE